MFLKISQISQEIACVRIFLLIKLQASPCNFIKKETLAQLFSCGFCGICKNIFFTEFLWVTDSLLFFIISLFIPKTHAKFGNDSWKDQVWWWSINKSSLYSTSRIQNCSLWSYCIFWLNVQFVQGLESYSNPRQTSRMELFGKTVLGFQLTLSIYLHVV